MLTQPFISGRHHYNSALIYLLSYKITMLLAAATILTQLIELSSFGFCTKNDDDDDLSTMPWQLSTCNSVELWVLRPADFVTVNCSKFRKLNIICLERQQNVEFQADFCLS